ncbi:uncharacterized protein FIBRA_02017 [Fibroporia radiculosa]|uniref:DNA (cytosine-5-)-methyltransferase n=1 Tax=Fibroporia radiculosa TaxID=599839 RepID=J4HU89_9APHY|nr:uncharacterized protein FIBRA_02017 [Fibroporia radiculosa]CCL99992.1 predicted protein [Fibroporia radiculosa]
MPDGFNMARKPSFRRQHMQMDYSTWTSAMISQLNAYFSGAGCDAWSQAIVNLRMNQWPSYRFTWRPKECAFVEVSRHEVSNVIDKCKPWKKCYICGKRSEERKDAAFVLLADGGVMRRGVYYHVHDFVYVRPDSSTASFDGSEPVLSRIGQITELKFDRNGQVFAVGVRWYGRYAAVVRQNGQDSHNAGSVFTDSRRFFYTDDVDVIHPGEIEHKIYVATSTTHLQEMVINGWLNQHPRTPQLLPDMPKPGEVDFIYGGNYCAFILIDAIVICSFTGPPCQSFSGMNHYKRADDIRNTLVCNMLSYVEFYQPLYFLLENVTGLLFYPLNGRQEGRAIVGGVKMGVVKFILRTLVSLGYQVRFKVLQAGQYGSPQDRKRVIFWGAKQGLPLPEFPLPTHSFPRGVQAFKLPTGDILRPVTRSDHSATTSKSMRLDFAPLLPVTVNEALSDLPPFDWINPFVSLRPTSQQLDSIQTRLAAGIRRFDALTSPHSTYPGFNDATPYLTLPMNSYQEWIRQGSSSLVKHQYTRRFAASVVERVLNVPFGPEADHTDLPHQLRISRMWQGVCGRIDENGFFGTALTTVMPTGQCGKLLHPNQKRIVTVRECARAQGFPDWYEFHSINMKAPDVVADQHRQIGNAVPVPLALALGKALGKALSIYWTQKERDALSPEI